MLWSDKAFDIYLGDAGQGIDPARADAAADVMTSIRSQVSAGEDCGDAIDAPNSGWFTRTVTSLANRAALTRIARS